MWVKNIKKHNSQLRALTKALTYRITSTIATAFIAYFVTNNTKIALSIGLLDLIVKFFIYYFHERAWNYVK